MGACPFEHYALPTIDFVGGETQELLFHAFTRNRIPFPLSRCTASFAVVDHLNRGGAPVIGPLEMSVVSDGCGCDNLLFVKIPSQKTKELDGKYIYQISITETETGDVDIPKQGVLLIAKNINN